MHKHTRFAVLHGRIAVAAELCSCGMLHCMLQSWYSRIVLCSAKVRKCIYVAISGLVTCYEGAKYVRLLPRPLGMCRPADGCARDTWFRSRRASSPRNHSSDNSLIYL